VVKSNHMDLQTLLNDRRAGELALRISRLLPKRLGYGLADLIGSFITSRRHTLMAHAIRTNQWVLHQGKIDSPQLDQLTRQVWRNTARAFYDMFHHIGHPDELQEMVVIPSELERIIRLSQEKKQGIVITGVHLSWFDLAMAATGYRGLRGTALGLPQTTEAMDWQHAMRRQTGINVVAATMPNIRHAIRRLEEGEALLTGVDRPMDGEAKHLPRFCGRPAHLPVHYVQIALRAKAPVIIFAPIMRPDGHCHIMASDFIEMLPHPDREVEIIQNAERVLEIAADFIRQAPEQWSIFHPVWPDAITETP
jgi:lauroyl/myristoyl acyltransferase